MLPLNVTLSYYKRQDIQEAIVEQCMGKEVAVKFQSHFGKRPDVLVYGQDILSLAQKKATSFHVSEETWSSPMQLKPGMRAKDLDEMRIGWDLILDVDFPLWPATKIITHILIKALLSEGIPEEAITVKFSGNKGFHIAVPFEAFPYSILDANDNEILTSDLFPDGVKHVVEYLVRKIDGPENDFGLSRLLKKKLGSHLPDNMFVMVNTKTGKPVEVTIDGVLFLCPNCEWSTRSKEEYVVCEKCNNFMDCVEKQAKPSEVVAFEKVDLAVDAMLVSSRHLYRMVYSLHEKSGLASIPIPINSVLKFKREQANPKDVKISVPFLNRNVPQDCGRLLLQRSMEHAVLHAEKPKTFKEVEWSGDAAPEEFFPPPITKMLAGLRDGKKRALFVLTNFLRSIGWSYEMIEARLIEWNKLHPEPMREGDIQRHLRYHQQKNQLVLPPNFDNAMYYQDLGVLDHDELSKRVKNPVQYVRLRIKQQGKPQSKS